jgi:hypothetical protein
MNGVVLKLKTQETIWLKIYLAFTSQFSALRLFSSQNNGNLCFVKNSSHIDESAGSSELLKFSLNFGTNTLSTCLKNAVLDL